jgi:hypothetical protein
MPKRQIIGVASIKEREKVTTSQQDGGENELKE